MAGEARRDAQYVLGHSNRELERLSTQAQLYNPFTHQFLREAGIEAGMRVLDVGCGRGDVSFIVARLVGPTGSVVGVDRGPVAVEAANQRVRDLSATNVRFLVADAGDLAAEGPFDAAVGRLVLEFSRDPAALLQSVAGQVRPGGVIAFHEVDWSGCRSFPDVPTISRCIRWGTETLQRSGADPYMGLKLHATFVRAGLPPPKLSVHAAVGAGPEHPVYAAAAEFVRTVLPAIEAQGVATARDVDVETLASRISEEATATGATVVWWSLVGAATRKPPP
jgi:SAM-dependent methyltransferase